MPWISGRWTWRSLGFLAGGLAAVALIGLGVWSWKPWETGGSADSTREDESRPALRGPLDVVQLDPRQLEALGVRSVRVQVGSISQVLDAYGEVIPDEDHYAYITPRAQGIVREVEVQIGQHVEQGELLARIDSERVADARLDLINSLQRLEIARARLNWQESIYQNALDMIDALERQAAPEEIQTRFADRPIGQTREQLLTAYSQFHLSVIEARRYANLHEKQAVSLARYQQEQAELEVDRAIYRGLMDRMAFEVTLDYTRARQTLREAQTAVKVALATLDVLGVDPETILERFESGELTREAPEQTAQRTLEQAVEAAIAPSRDLSNLLNDSDVPVSTYELRAPFAGTILERERIVPGVVVDGTNRLFTMANLETVWVEAHVHESDFDALARSEGGTIEFASPSYPDRVFSGRILYTGDLVDEKSRTVRMIAEAANPERLLKPGMFVDVKVHADNPAESLIIPESAVLVDDDRRFVFVRVGPERFERRLVRIGPRREDEVAVFEGLEAGEEVVISGAFELKAALLASGGRDEQRGGRASRSRN